MAARSPDSLERPTQADLMGVVRELIGEVGRLRTENEKLSGAFAELKTEHQAVKDELARLKSLPPRLPQKPSGMDKATDPKRFGRRRRQEPRREEVEPSTRQPEIPLNTNASENDIRTFVTKRKISGGTVSDSGRNARGIMLGLAKTCMRLKLSALITLLWMIHHSYDREFPGQGHRSGLQRRKPEGFSGQFGKDGALEIAIP
jgi:Transposase IS66 family